MFGNFFARWIYSTGKYSDQFSVFVKQEFGKVPFDLSVLHSIFFFAGEVLK
jgi:hypothetical protein